MWAVFNDFYRLLQHTRLFSRYCSIDILREYAVPGTFVRNTLCPLFGALFTDTTYVEPLTQLDCSGAPVQMAFANRGSSIYSYPSAVMLTCLILSAPAGTDLHAKCARFDRFGATAILTPCRIPEAFPAA